MAWLSNPTFIQSVANIATLLFAGMMVLQILLALGVLPVSMAWGGRQSQLTPALRAASLATVVLFGAFIYVIRYRAGLLGEMPIPAVIQIFSWVITAWMALNTLGNLASASKTEKLIFTPLTIVLTIACWIVSASNPDTVSAVSALWIGRFD